MALAEAAPEYGELDLAPIHNDIGILYKFAGRADALLAATASVHGLTLATRNVKDFAHAGVALVNPWEI